MEARRDAAELSVRGRDQSLHLASRAVSTRTSQGGFGNPDSQVPVTRVGGDDLKPLG
jgi:hypothetical protein